MKKKFNFIFLLTILTFSIFPSLGYSSFIEKPSDSTFQDSNRNINVTFNIYNYGRYYEEITNGESEEVEGQGLNLSGYLGEVRQLYNTYNVGDELGGDYARVRIQEGLEVYEYYYVCSNKYMDRWNTRYNFVAPRYRVKVGEYILRHSDDVINSYNYSIKAGSKINVNLFDELNDTIWFNDLSFTTLFDFSNVINQETIIYGLRSENNESIADITASNIINNNSGSLKLYDASFNISATGNSYNVSTDINYFNNILFLNAATIQSGANVDLLAENDSTGNNPEGSLGNQDDIRSNHSNSDSTLSLTNNTKTLNITLLGDLTINGNLTVGAKTGNLTDSGELQSYIIGNYASIDLNGHNLIVNGTLRVFGEIKDSKNTGKIVVNNGGELYSLMSYTDGRGGNHTIWGYSKEQSPFTDYRFPYISSKILLNYGSRVRAYTKFNLGQLGGSAATFNLLGTDNQNYYLTWCGDSNDYIEIIPYSVGNITNSNFLNRLYNYRYKIDIYGDLQFNNAYTTVQFSVSALIFNLNGSIDLYLSRVNFPISSFFDINVLNDSKILLLYKIILYPGATLFVDENASLEFSYINNFAYERVSFEGIKHIPEVTKNLSGGIISYNYSFNKYSNPSISSIDVGLYSSTYSSYFTNYFNVNSANILGNIIFNSGNSEKYVFSGEINLSLNALNSIKNNSNMIQTYYSLGQQNNDVWFSGASEAIAAGNDNAIVRVNSYLTLPLISNGSAYLISDSLSLSEGNYDSQNNIIEKNNEYYFVAGSDTVLEDNNSNQDNPIDTTVTIIKAEYINKEIQAVYENGKFYVYYCGTYVKANGLRLEGNSIIIIANDTVTINLGKFFSNSSKVSDNYNEFSLRFSNNMWTKVSGI